MARHEDRPPASRPLPPKSAAKQARLAEALRANLRRRKASGRKAAEDGDAGGGAGTTAGGEEPSP